MSMEQPNTMQVPRSLKKFGTKEQLRDYLGDLIHALRSHVPCVYHNRDDPLWCNKVTPCLRTAYRLCHMHGCHIRGKCEDNNKCRYVWKLLSHWYYCENELCFVCSPWVKPVAVHGQSRTFLNDVFGVEPLFKTLADFLTKEHIYCTSEPVIESIEAVSEEEKDDAKSTDFEIDIQSSKTCVNLGVQANFGTLEFSKVPIQRNNVRKGFCIRHRHKKFRRTSDNAVFVIAEKNDSCQVTKWDVSIQVDLPVRFKSVKPGTSGCRTRGAVCHVKA